VASNRDKKNIGIILPTTSHIIEHHLLRGVRAGLPEDQYNLICITVAWLAPWDNHFRLAKKIHNSLDKSNIHGIITYSASIANQVQPECILEITDCYPNIPAVNIGDAVENLLSVTFDNKNPIIEMVSHLVNEQHCQSIAFLGGPKDNFDAEQRRSAFTEQMHLLGLQTPAELYWPGLYSITSGIEAIRNFLNTGAPLPDAIVCVNDYSAIGVIDELLAHGIRIPEDLKITGFDNLDNSMQRQVPITTAVYPIYQMALSASQTLDTWIKGDKPDAIDVVPSKVILRRSSGHCENKPESSKEKEDVDHRSRDTNSNRLEISKSINRADTRAETVKQAITNLYDVGVRDVYVFEYEANSTNIEQVYTVTNGEFVLLEKDNILYQSPFISNIQMAQELEELNWVITPIITGTNNFGFIMLYAPKDELDFNEYLAYEIARKFETLRLTEKADFLQKQVKESEKMASIGVLVNGVAHEINSPLGISLVAASHINDDVKHISELMENGNMTQTAFTEFINTSKDSSKILLSNLHRTAELVKSFKEVSVVEHIDSLSMIELKSFFKNLLDDLNRNFNNTNVSISYDIDEKLKIKSYPRIWSQIITNLILNSFAHAFSQSDEQYEIKLTATSTQENLTITISDSGLGIPSDNLDSIFDPFYTTARSQGLKGLGLNVVYNMVTQKLLGKITVTSTTNSNNHGTTFTINVPLRLPA